MKASSYPGARRAHRRAFRAPGRDRAHLTLLEMSHWFARFSIAGVGEVRVPVNRRRYGYGPSLDDATLARFCTIGGVA